MNCEALPPPAPEREGCGMSLLGPVAESLATELAVVDHQGVILGVNAAWRRFGEENGLRSPGDGVGLNYLEVCRQAQGPSSKAANDMADGLAAVLSGERATCYREYPCHGPGERRWYSVRITPLDLPAGRGALIAHDPISGRMLAEEELLRLQARYRGLLDMVGDAVLVIGLDHGFLNVNAAACERYGYHREAWSGLQLDDVVAASQRPLVDARLQRIVALGKSVHHSQHLAADGRVMPTEVNSLLIEYDGQQAILAVCRDLSDRQQLDTSQQRLAAALDAINDGIVLTNAEGVVTHVNHGFERMTGIPREALVGQLPTVLSGEAVPTTPLFVEVLETLRSGRMWEGQMVLRRQDGTPVTTRSTMVPLFDDQGKVIEFLAVHTDITDELAMQRQAARGEVIELVGRLSEGLAHDFHNLLLEIGGYAELATGEQNDRGQLASDLLAIQDAAARGASLVGQLLAFGRQEAMTSRPCDIADLLGELEQLLRPMLGEDVDLQIEPGEAGPTIRADYGAVQQMIVQLALLARETMPQGGCVGVSAEPVRAAAPGQPERAWLRLTVSDNGQGLTPEVRERLFDGLAQAADDRIPRLTARPTVQSMIESFGGWLHAESRPALGTTVHLYFALADEPEPPVTALAESLAELGGEERLLVIEDEPSLRAAMVRVLRGAGYGVDEAGDGPAAHALAASWTAPPALLITDVMLPGDSGIQIVEAFRERWPGLPVLYVSGYSEGREVLSKLRAGDRFLPKPFGFAGLQRQVREVLDSARKGSRGDQ